MVRRSAGTVLLVLGATAVAVGLGGAAIAGPGGAPTALKPTSELSSSGGVSAPSEIAPDGAAEAPVAEPAPAPAEPAPPTEAVPPATAEVAPTPEETVIAEEPVPGAQEEPETATPEPPEPPPEPADEVEPAVEPATPTSGEMLGEEQRPLVPVAVLSAPVESASEGDPLVDIAQPDAEVRAVAAQEGEDGEGGDQDDDEIIIPVDPDRDAPDDTPVDGEGDDTVPGINVPATSRPRDQLALTGLALEGPLGAGLVLLLLGAMLRITARPTSEPAPA